MNAAKLDAVIVGAGPNGLAAAIELARQGAEVEVLEAGEAVGGGTRTREMTLPGFLHDECSAIHPLGLLSPFFARLPLAEHGLEWVQFKASVGHPLDDRPAAVLYRSFAATGARLGADANKWRLLLEPHVRRARELLPELLHPLRALLRHPLEAIRLALLGVRSASGLANSRFAGPAARALLAGCAAHAVLPLERLGSAGAGVVFAMSGHLANWPCVRGGSQNLARAMASYLRRLGGSIQLGRRVRSLRDLPPSRVVLFDVSPRQLLRIAGAALPAGYQRGLSRFHYGPAAFKLDWALTEAIPWRDPALRACSTVHVGGTLEEIAEHERSVWAGVPSRRPFMIVCQQSVGDPSRAPAGRHTGYAYCHVPHGSAVDMTEAMEQQLERFAPGFRDCILARHVTSPRDFEQANPNLVGGAITGGATTLRQMLARPVARLNPYRTPNRRLFLCSASTPPGTGVHGMCGYFSARAALRELRRARVLESTPDPLTLAGVPATEAC